MRNELILQEIVADWQEHAVPVQSPSLTDVHRRTRTFQQGIRLWNTFQYTMGAASIVSYLALLFAHPSIRFGIGAILIMTGYVFGMYRVHQERSARSVPSDFGSLRCLEFHRAELQRQRAFLLKSWRYLMLPLPGIAVLMLTQRPSSWLPVGEFVVIFALMFLGIVKARKRQARKLENEIEWIDAMTR